MSKEKKWRGRLPGSFFHCSSAAPALSHFIKIYLMGLGGCQRGIGTTPTLASLPPSPIGREGWSQF